MAKLALSRDLFDDYAKLEKRVRSRVGELIDRFQHAETPQELREAKGIHLERYNGAKDPRARTVRVTDNFRGIVLDAGDDHTYVLTRILSHDDADRWMTSNEFRVNAGTGALEVYDIEAVEAAADKLQQPKKTEPERLFAHRNDKDFTQLGIDNALIPALRMLDDDEQLLGLAQALPDSQEMALLSLSGNDSVEQIYTEIVGLESAAAQPEIDTEDLAAAVDAPASRGHHHVFTGDRELEEVLARPWVLWPTFLHPSQHDLAYGRSYTGPARVTGGAGTGKTVVAIHRAKALADLLPPDAPPHSILFTTYTANLAQVIEKDLHLLGGPELLEKIDVVNVDKLAMRSVLEVEGQQPVPVDEGLLDELWEQAAMGAATDYSPQFLRGEWEQIILGQGIEARDAYFKAKRAGRGVSLNRRARAEVWGIAEQVKHMLAERGQRSWLQIAGDAAGYMANRAVKPYLHVVVDEAQDLHQNQWRLLRAAVPDHDNDLFLVGDAHQRIYRAPAPLSKVGVHIVGRSRKLRLNYRTTHEILGWSLAALGEGDFDDLDDSTDNHDDGDYHSLLRGPAPELLGSPTRKDHYDELVAQVQQWIAKGLDPTEIGVAGRVADSVRSAMNAVSDAGHETELLTGEFKPKDGVKFGTMHRMKGLEFRALAIVDASSDRIPLATFLTPAHEDQRQHDADLQRERCLLYVAASRAREHLWVGWSGQPSRFLPSDAAE